MELRNVINADNFSENPEIKDIIKQVFRSCFSGNSEYFNGTQNSTYAHFYQSYLIIMP